MSNTLKILVHKKYINKNTFLAEQKKFIKNKTTLHSLLNEKLKDRHRIKGAYFSDAKVNMINKNKTKGKKETKLNNQEKNYKISMKNYNELKHEIFLKEKKEKEEIEKQKIADKKSVKKDINFTNIKDFMYTFLRFKNKSNLYKANLIKRNIELKSTNKMKKNFVNQSLKNAVLHFKKVRGKVDFGQMPIEETENELEYKNLFEQIVKSRLKYKYKIKNENDPLSSGVKSEEKKNIFFLNNSEESNKQNLFKINLNKSNEKNENDNIENNLEEKDDINKINSTEENKINENENKNEQKDNSFSMIKENNDQLSIDENNINNKKSKIKNIKKNKKYRYFLSEKGLKLDKNHINFFQIDTRSQRLNNFKLDSNIDSDSNFQIYPETSNIKNNKVFNYVSNKNVLNYKAFSSYDFENKITESENNLILYSNNTNEQNSNKINETNESINNNIQSLKSFNKRNKVEKNNYFFIKKQKNPAFWNTNIRRAQTPGLRSTNKKLKNKPFRQIKIEDLIKQYNRIKSTTSKSKRRMEERHFTTLGDIDKIMNVKEDMLMFNLKMKYFKSGYNYMNKKGKSVPKKKIFTKKIKTYVDMIDNPTNFDILDFEKEFSNENYF